MRPANLSRARRSPSARRGKSGCYAIAVTRSLALPAMRSMRVRALRTSRSSCVRALLPRRSSLRSRRSAPLRVVSPRHAGRSTSATARSRASSVAPTDTSAARSATLRPCLTVVLAARTLAVAASRVSLAAIVLLRRPVDAVGFLLALANASWRAWSCACGPSSCGPSSCARRSSAWPRRPARCGGGGGGVLSHLGDQPLRDAALSSRLAYLELSCLQRIHRTPVCKPSVPPCYTDWVKPRENAEKRLRLCDIRNVCSADEPSVADAVDGALRPPGGMRSRSIGPAVGPPLRLQRVQSAPASRRDRRARPASASVPGSPRRG